MLHKLEPNPRFSSAVPTNTIPILLLAIDLLHNRTTAPGKQYPKNNDEGLSLYGTLIDFRSRRVSQFPLSSYLGTEKRRSSIYRSIPLRTRMSSLRHMRDQQATTLDQRYVATLWLPPL
ncbi:hypothetical protein CDV36_001909 [Fusarium kuroshium]|uniref:Uncharacterized protein n=1 Tax=Fusarium kuroshium TaxID=2010991 RepID=A0A3M2SLE4_9HYPO|nr:hypothetical protein CDV36_001909 [Fusarium kuroshium]